jgi:hypothetical protein
LVETASVYALKNEFVSAIEYLRRALGKLII